MAGAVPHRRARDWVNRGRNSHRTGPKQGARPALRFARPEALAWKGARWAAGRLAHSGHGGEPARPPLCSLVPLLRGIGAGFVWHGQPRPIVPGGGLCCTLGSSVGAEAEAHALNPGRVGATFPPEGVPRARQFAADLPHARETA